MWMNQCEMPYYVWCDTYGKYRWFHEDGTPRTQYPLDYNWESIYSIATRTADIAFNDRVIYDVDTFTNEFLSNVPINWLKYKTSLEMFSGTLDGLTINPDVFEAGFTRTTNANENNTGNYNINSDTDGAYTDNLGNIDITEANNDTIKNRSILYEQGVQAYDDNLNISNIGNLGNDYASNFTDNVGMTVTNNHHIETARTNTGNTNASTDTAGNSNNNRTFNETIHETRINYYDNLAFLRERMDRLNLLESFQNYFLPYFASVSIYKGWWQ